MMAEEQIRKMRHEALGREQCEAGVHAQEAHIERLLLDRILAGTPYRAAVPVYDPKISETRHAGLTLLRLCVCGHRQVSGRDAIGCWHCVRCGRRVA